jgi:hypothetical protein
MVSPMENTDGEAIQFEVVLEGKYVKNKNRPNGAALPRGSPIKGRKENRSTKPNIELCCVTMRAGPGTLFGDYQIPQGAKCSVCGSEVQKGRM